VLAPAPMIKTVCSVITTFVWTLNVQEVFAALAITPPTSPIPLEISDPKLSFFSGLFLARMGQGAYGLRFGATTKIVPRQVQRTVPSESPSWSGR